tara:strand:+ start:1064 stop:1993 length:930 start_codon:yes stop_codon:yes gene_type:complete
MNLKKPKFWDYKKPNFYSYILWPISILIKTIIRLKPKRKKNYKEIKTICVGNIYIGGTGKTSLALKVNEILKKKKIKSCFIKKYYKSQIDEQNILKNNGKLFCEKNRNSALNQAISENFEVAIFDDGLQDDSINYDINLICFNSRNFIGNGMTIPSGPLRQDLNILKNYNHIFLNGEKQNYSELENKALEINPNITIHKGKYVPTNLNEFNINNNYLVFSGIGNHKTFIEMLKEYGIRIVKDLEFADHYFYQNKDIENIISLSKKLECEIITTEKDYLRLSKDKPQNIKFIKAKLVLADEQKLIKVILN